MPDNFHFDMQGVPLALALPVALADNRTVVAWREIITRASDEPDRLTFYWSGSHAHVNPFPVEMDAQALTPVIEAWLKTAEPGLEPDIDGSIEKGWRIYKPTRSLADDSFYVVFCVEPVWLEYHK